MKQPWSAEKQILGIHIAKTTADELRRQSAELGISASKLARYFIETGLGLDRPGMRNADGGLWEKDE